MPITPHNRTLEELLSSLRHELLNANLLSTATPSSEALSSIQPFCIDTLTFEQWLQFIFIPKLTLLISNEQPLPNSIAICPYAEEALKNHGNKVSGVINVIADIDELLSGKRQQTLFLNKYSYR